jgi:hypothetical protein
MFVSMESHTSETIMNTITILRIESIGDISPHIIAKEEVLGIMANNSALITPFRIPSEICHIHTIFPSFDITTETHIFTIGTLETLVHILCIYELIPERFFCFYSFEKSLWLGHNPFTTFCHD